ARRHARRPFLCADVGSGLALRLRTAGTGHRHGDGRPQPAAVPHHPPLPDAGVLRADRAAARGGRMALILDLLLQGVQMFLVVLIAPLVLGVTRRVKARIHRRIGPPLTQPYRDIWKLMHKDVVLAHNASWLYRVAPYFVFAATWVAAALIPTYATG